MKFHDTRIEGVVVVELEPIRDERGHFARTWCRSDFADAGVDVVWEQANVGVSEALGTLRGLHLQSEPFGEYKLVRCTRGSVFDVAVDLREGSATRLEWFAIEMSSETGVGLVVPPGCAHGYLTLAPDTQLEYMTSVAYEPSAATGVRFDDPALAITWPYPPDVISDQDRNWPLVDSE